MPRVYCRGRLASVSTLEDPIALGKNLLVGNYARRDICMVRGEGTRLWDSTGKEYLDLFAGFGGCVLGHCHPELIEAATEQMKTLWHVGNSFYTEPQLRFAKHLNEKAFAGKAFFCHGGMDSNESAVKLARLRGSTASPRKFKIVTFNASFHGRSLAMAAAGSTEMHRQGFEPMPQGFVHATGGDFDDLLKHVDDETAGIMFEPLRGEGGMLGYPADFPAKVRQLCDERDITLIFDEVWVGGGRSGKWFGHQWFDGEVTPDVMTLGKAIGGGLPAGAMWASEKVADVLTPGKHGSTLGGNCVVMAVAAKIFDVMERDNLVDHARKLGDAAIEMFAGELPDCPVRGTGLFLGVQLPSEIENFVGKALEAGIVLNVTQKDVIRLAPPIDISEDEWRQGVEQVIGLVKQHR